MALMQRYDISSCMLRWEVSLAFAACPLQGSIVLPPTGIKHKCVVVCGENPEMLPTFVLCGSGSSRVLQIVWAASWHWLPCRAALSDLNLHMRCTCHALLHRR